MKKSIIFKGALAIAVAGMMTACSSDYLELQPVDSVTSDLVFSNTELAAGAINSICQAMFMQQANTQSTGGYPAGKGAGEAYIMTLQGDAFGPDYNLQHLIMFSSGEFVRGEWMSNPRDYFSSAPYGYLYMLVGQANAILDNIDGAEESVEGQRDLVKAEALTFRAHAYTRLLQMFGPRWEDSANGENKCIVLRTKYGSEPLPLASMNDVLNQIYADLTEATTLFAKPEVAALPRPNLSTPNINVAYGVWARAALLKQDWQTAYDAAKNARQGHTIMSAEEWCGGFMEATDDYMWTNTLDVLDYPALSNWAMYNTCNGYMVVFNWKLGAGAIDMGLYRQLDEKDIRRSRFLTPDKITKVTGIPNPDTCWCSSNFVVPIGQSAMNVYQAMDKSDPMYRKKLNWVAAINKWIVNATPKAPSYATAEMVPAYTNPDGPLPKDTYYQFGAQLKFYNGDREKNFYQYPYMRSTEMLLTMAEAAYMMGNTGEAQTLISELMSKRIEGFTSCTKTGQDLLDEIRLQRRIELWGEGTTFFDFKRWNIPMVRKAWVEGDPEVGNISAEASCVWAPNANHHWVRMIPQAEYEYNDAIDLNELNYLNE